MEQYLKHTEEYLVATQELMKEEDIDISAKAGGEIYEAMQEIAEKHDLNYLQVINVILAITYGVVSTTLEEIDEDDE